MEMDGKSAGESVSADICAVIISRHRSISQCQAISLVWLAAANGGNQGEKALAKRERWRKGREERVARASTAAISINECEISRGWRLRFRRPRKLLPMIRSALEKQRVGESERRTKGERKESESVVSGRTAITATLYKRSTKQGTKQG